MSDLVEFLTARLDQDQRLAEDAESVWSVIGRNPKPYPGVVHKPDDWMKAEAFSLNINPFRVLAEVEAKRVLVKRAAMLLASFDDPERGAWPDVNRRERFHARSMLKLLAAPYRDHPDYDPSSAVDNEGETR